MSDKDSGGDEHPAKKWYDHFDLDQESYVGGHFARDPTNAYAAFNNPNQELIDEARQKAENLGLEVFEYRNTFGDGEKFGEIESVKLRALDPDETTLVEVLVEQGLPHRLHEMALYERDTENTED